MNTLTRDHDCTEEMQERADMLQKRITDQYDPDSFGSKKYAVP